MPRKLNPIWLYPFEGPFLALQFASTALWSLRTSDSTSSGGKTLTSPTPYSLKLALVDALIQGGRSTEEAQQLFELLRGRPLRVKPPAEAVVSGVLVKMRKLERAEGSRGTIRRFDPTMGYREYAHFGGRDREMLWEIAVSSVDLAPADRELIALAARRLNYSGKRGGFLRFVPANTPDGLEETTLKAISPYTIPLSSAPEGFLLGIIHQFDELPSTAEWDRVSTFGEEKVRLVREGDWDGNADRVLVATNVPYRLVASSRTFTHYRRADLCLSPLASEMVTT